MSKFKPEYEIGDSIAFSKTVSFEYESLPLPKNASEWKVCDSKRIVVRKDKQGNGKVVGGKYCRLGIWGYGDDTCGHYWKEEFESVFVYLVKVGYIGKEIMVLPNDLCLTKANHPFPFGANNGTLSEKDRKAYSEAMKEEMKNWPRNAKGQWVTWKEKQRIEKENNLETN